MTKTFYEIMGDKKYKELTNDEIIAYNERVDQLATNFVGGQADAFSELYDALTGFIKGLAYRYAQNSFSVEQDDFEGIINLVLVESLSKYDPTLEIPFQPFFAMNVRNEVKMQYRRRSKDVHDTTLASNKYRIDAPLVRNSEEFGSEALWLSEKPIGQMDNTEDAFVRVLADELISGCYGDDQLKRTIILMYLDGFKRGEIVKAIKSNDKEFATVEKFVYRTVKGFKEYAISLT